MEFALKEALKLGGCPVCRVISEEFSRILWWFEREGYHEISTLRELILNPHICQRHALLIKSMGSNLSVTFEYLINEDRKLLKDLQSLTGLKAKRLLSKEMEKNCRFCKIENSIEERAIKAFSKLFGDEEFRLLYEKSPSGLCRAHFVMILENLRKNSNEYTFLIGISLRRLNAISERFDRFFHKQDYRFSSEEKGDEQNAWQEAFEFYKKGGP